MFFSGVFLVLHPPWGFGHLFSGFLFSPLSSPECCSSPPSPVFFTLSRFFLFSVSPVFLLSISSRLFLMFSHLQAFSFLSLPGFLGFFLFSISILPGNLCSLSSLQGFVYSLPGLFVVTLLPKVSLFSRLLGFLLSPPSLCVESTFGGFLADQE